MRMSQSLIPWHQIVRRRSSSVRISNWCDVPENTEFLHSEPILVQPGSVFILGMNISMFVLYLTLYQILVRIVKFTQKFTSLALLSVMLKYEVPMEMYRLVWQSVCGWGWFFFHLPGCFSHTMASCMRVIQHWQLHVKSLGCGRVEFKFHGVLNKQIRWQIESWPSSLDNVVWDFLRLKAKWNPCTLLVMCVLIPRHLTHLTLVPCWCR